METFILKQITVMSRALHLLQTEKIVIKGQTNNLQGSFVARKSNVSQVIVFLKDPLMTN